MEILKISEFKELRNTLKKHSIDLDLLKDRLLSLKKIIVICGPTGIGKSKLGISMSGFLDTDIISVDSMQIYRGMDIGTDKINTENYGIKQYMIDLFDPDHKLTVMEFRNIAKKIISEEFIKSCKIPVMVGGSGLYIKAIIDDLDKGPGEDREFRRGIEEDIKKNGPKKHYGRLLEIDRDYALKISENDSRRIIRALEVFHLSGTPFSQLQRAWARKTACNVTFVGLDRDRSQLYQNIEKRVENMFNRSLVKEVESLIKKGYKDSFSLRQAVGYKEVIAYIEGKTDLDKCKDEVKKNSRRLAKKQMTWFNRDSRINWIRVDNYDNMFDLIIDTFKIINRESGDEKN
ncbi:MAG: tRNA (adenosine(37)-N6)-dimethylallyltransferase MiaA [Actinomycetota bacterium]|nr:MAG: tRNA (adenosine(37)-N6)-dimethylallyltransferase MiaA [Actinomycetota bacterium]